MIRTNVIRPRPLAPVSTLATLQADACTRSRAWRGERSTQDGSRKISSCSTLVFPMSSSLGSP